MPNIENLKKQAKQYLRWHREPYYPVATQIRATLPRFRGMGDVEILHSGFKLADAQELIARREGFDSWQALISGADVNERSPNQTALRPILTSIEAQLFVASVQNSSTSIQASLALRSHSSMATHRSMAKWYATCATQFAAGVRACFLWRYSQARRPAFRFHHSCYTVESKQLFLDFRLQECRSIRC